jgi:hypothetical protein
MVAMVGAGRFLLLALVVTTGCTTIGRSYRGVHLRADPALIVEGRTTKSEVLRLFGPPDFINHQTTGDAFVYRFEQVNSTSVRVWDPITRNNWFTYNRLNERSDRLVVLFDFLGVVNGVAHDRNVEDMPTL